MRICSDKPLRPCDDRRRSGPAWVTCESMLMAYDNSPKTKIAAEEWFSGRPKPSDVGDQADYRLSVTNRDKSRVPLR